MPERPASSASRSGNGAEPPSPGRRDVLKLAGLGAAAASGAALTAEALESPEEQVRERYRLTPHVERYYFLNRL